MIWRFLLIHGQTAAVQRSYFGSKVKADKEWAGGRFKPEGAGDDITVNRSQILGKMVSMLALRGGKGHRFSTD